MSHFYMGVIVPGALLFPIAAGTIWYKHLPKALQYIFYYLIISGCINIAAVVLSFNTMNNLPLLHLLTVVELFLLLMYFSTIIRFKKSRIVIQTVCAASILFCIADALWIESIFTFNSYARGITSIIMIFFSILYFILPGIQLKPAEFIYVTVGIMAYYAGSFFIFLFANFLKKGYHLSTVLWNINATLVLVMYILFTIAFSLCRKTTVSISSSL